MSKLTAAHKRRAKAERMACKILDIGGMMFPQDVVDLVDRLLARIERAERRAEKQAREAYIEGHNAGYRECLEIYAD